jgi:hypothetical protein
MFRRRETKIRETRSAGQNQIACFPLIWHGPNRKRKIIGDTQIARWPYKPRNKINRGDTARWSHKSRKLRGRWYTDTDTDGYADIRVISSTSNIVEIQGEQSDLINLKHYGGYTDRQQSDLINLKHYGDTRRTKWSYHPQTLWGIHRQQSDLINLKHYGDTRRTKLSHKPQTLWGYKENKMIS